MGFEVTKYKEICFFCGRQAEAEHHLIFGAAGRALSEKDGLKVPICNNCHNMGRMTQRIHGNIMAEKLSKMLGQALWERQWILQDAVHGNAILKGIGDDDEDMRLEARIARKEFMSRYGKSYI